MLVALLGLAPAAFAGRATTDRGVAAWRQSAQDARAALRVIVRTRPAALDPVHARLAAKGRRPHAHQRALDTLAVTVDRADLDALLADPDVLGVSADLPVVSAGKASKTVRHQAGCPSRDETTIATTSTTDWRWSHVVTTLGVDRLQVDGHPVMGAGVGIAVIDSGIANLPNYGIASSWTSSTAGRMARTTTSGTARTWPA